MTTDFKIFGAFNALRRPSEATTPWLVRIFCITRSSGGFPHYGAFFRRFPFGIRKTSDFFKAKFRGFASKVRMFVPKKSGVFDPKNGIFHTFSPLFCGIFAESGKEVWLRSL